MGGLAIYPCWVSNGRNTKYLSSFFIVTFKGNLSLQYVNSKNKIFRSGFGEKGRGLAISVAPKMHSILRHSRRVFEIVFT